MKTQQLRATLILTGLMLFSGCDAKKDTTPPPSKPVDTKVDSDQTGDEGPALLTPIDQSESPAHIKTTAEIRKAVMSDQNLSMGAKNCKIITDKTGAVTLRGMVDSQAEKVSIEALTKQLAGGGRIDNQLEIKTPAPN